MKILNLILLIDDDETTNFINNRTLTKANIARRIQIYPDAEDALQYLRQANAGAAIVPELIFLDIKMPKMDGFEFLEEYRKIGIKDPQATKIMLLTSSASFYDLKRMEEFEEVKRHFSKPLTPHDVKEIMTEYFPEDMASV
ncbi:response regulator [Adhaeribacter pallidiroseus]|uniref:Putative methanoproteinis regulatory protein FilR2 n=1 Tax=Adhaeribacter pallidiroseus TaxID=2072847 RepID=A0A369QLQ1_9BACT|nr:response regulator [Adhaeribacter pallidiroseus]RDC64575.1 putative methanoproteinis regulatory protein FilR2 [Adhaeribacter pallidiroseus]